MCAMPRANPPPSANPIAGRGLTSGEPGLRESSRPKACTERIILPRLFTENPTFPLTYIYIYDASLWKNGYTTMVLDELRLSVTGYSLVTIQYPG